MKTKSAGNKVHIGKSEYICGWVICLSLSYIIVQNVLGQEFLPLVLTTYFIFETLWLDMWYYMYKATTMGFKIS